MQILLLPKSENFIKYDPAIFFKRFFFSNRLLFCCSLILVSIISVTISELFILAFYHRNTFPKVEAIFASQKSKIADKQKRISKKEKEVDKDYLRVDKHLSFNEGFITLIIE